MKTIRMKLLKRTVKALKPKTERYEVLDKITQGFMLRVNPNGKKIFCVYYRVNGQRRRPALGIYDEKTLSVDKARTEAEKYISNAKLGRDLSAEKKIARDSETFSEFSDLFLRDVALRAKARTGDDYRRQLKLHLLPAWGSKKLSAIRPSDITSLHRKLAKPRKIKISSDRAEVSYVRTMGGPGGANRYLSLVKAMFNFAEREGIIPPGSNPALHVKSFKEKGRERFLTPDELSRLAEAINAIESEKSATPWAAGAIRLLMFTGARRDEILTLQWSFVDEDAKCLRLPESKTGAKVIHLNSAAFEVMTRLALIRRKDNPYVICGHKRGERLVNITKPWYRIRERACLPDLRLHDLRHVYAGMGASLGLGLPIVGKLLGHSQPSTTQRYANLAPDPVAAANELIGQGLIDAMARGRANIIEIGKGTEKQAPAETAG